MNIWLIILFGLIIMNLASASLVYVLVIPKARKFWYGVYWLTIFSIIIDIGILLA